VLLLFSLGAIFHSVPTVGINTDLFNLFILVDHTPVEASGTRSSLPSLRKIQLESAL